MGAAVLSGLLAGYGIAMPAGAISVFLIKLGATACLCIGAAAGLGAATADRGYALTAGAGGPGLARQVNAGARHHALNSARARVRHGGQRPVSSAADGGGMAGRAMDDARARPPGSAPVTAPGSRSARRGCPDGTHMPALRDSPAAR